MSGKMNEARCREIEKELKQKIVKLENVYDAYSAARQMSVQLYFHLMASKEAGYDLTKTEMKFMDACEKHNIPLMMLYLGEALEEEAPHTESIVSRLKDGLRNLGTIITGGRQAPNDV